MDGFHRQLNLNDLLAKKSIFLLGPRATGKTYLAREQLGDAAVFINLLRANLYLRLSSSPWDLEEMIDGQRKDAASAIVVIDEIQKIPSLLDEVHRLIEERRFRFLLTGSSARKLRHGHANMLAGRAWKAELHPLSWSEIPDFNLERYLHTGGLPVIYRSDDSDEELNAYVRTYLYEEVQAEGFVRNLPQFSRFLMNAALANGQLLNFAQISSDSQVPASTIKEHYQILEDTLLGFRLEPWAHAKTRKAIATSKFYLFDTGVARTLAGIGTIDRNSDTYGRAFEHWVATELRSYLSYRRKHESLCFWRTRHQLEVDFVIGSHTAIEVKAARRVGDQDAKNLRAIAEEGSFKHLLLVSHDPVETRHEGVTALHWKTFVDQLWSGKLDVA